MSHQIIMPLDLLSAVRALLSLAHVDGRGVPFQVSPRAKANVTSAAGVVFAAITLAVAAFVLAGTMFCQFMIPCGIQWGGGQTKVLGPFCRLGRILVLCRERACWSEDALARPVGVGLALSSCWIWKWTLSWRLSWRMS